MDWMIDLETAFPDVFSRRKLFALVACWLAGILTLVAYGTVSARQREFADSLPVGLPVVHGHETGPFAVRRGDPRTSSRAACRVAFDNLRAEQGLLEPFEPVAGKVVRIDNLSVTFLRPSQAADVADERLALADFHSLLAPSPYGSLQAGVPGLFEDLMGDPEGWTVAVDLTNSAEVLIQGMDWRICRDEQTVFRAQCGHAQLSAGTPDVVLHDHASVSAGGATLESDCIRMDTRNDRIVIDGRYTLTRDGNTHAGTGACFSTDLELLEAYGPRDLGVDAGVSNEAMEIPAWTGPDWNTLLTRCLEPFDCLSGQDRPLGPNLPEDQPSDNGSDPLFGTSAAVIRDGNSRYSPL